MPTIIATPWADIRKDPEIRGPFAADGRDLGLQTQLLYGEEVRVVSQKGPWAFIEALEQPLHTEEGWGAYRGWTSLKSLAHISKIAVGVLSVAAKVYSNRSLESKILGTLQQGSFLSGDYETESWVHLATGGWIYQPCLVGGKEEKLMAPLLQWLEIPYLWGGCTLTPTQGGVSWGIDCSGLVHLAYRLIGKKVPRDAHDQWLACTPISSDQLQPGDLIFFSRPEGQRMHHVIMVMNPTETIESRGSIGHVLRTPIKQRCEWPDGIVQSGEVIQGDQLWFGRFKFFL